MATSYTADKSATAILNWKEFVMQVAQQMMKAVVMNQFGGAEVFEWTEVQKPIPEPTQLLVRVHATSVNPVDYQTRRGDYKEYVRLPVIIGVDVSGVVEAVGAAVKDFSVGDTVYYSPQIFATAGSYAEYHVVDESIVSHKPTNLSHVEAASLPLSRSAPKNKTV